jgi:uncharacterized membrane protein YgaE (UPF0421/DUF939 family)
VGTDEQSNKKDNLLIALFSIVLSVLISVLFYQNFVLINTSNDIYEKVNKKVNEKIENIAKDSKAINDIKEQEAKNKEFKKEFAKSIKLELHRSN